MSGSVGWWEWQLRAPVPTQHYTTLHSDPPPPTGGVKGFHWVLATIVSSVEVHVKLAKRFWWEVPGPEMETAGRKRVLFSDNTPLLSLSCDSQSQRQFINSEILPFWPNNVNWLTQYLAPPGDREGEGGQSMGVLGIRFVLATLNREITPRSLYCGTPAVPDKLSSQSTE